MESIPRRRRQPHTFLVLGLLALVLLARSARGDAFTYRFQPQERQCFYVHAEKEDEKIAFYFAVQSGGNFDIDYEVRFVGNDRPILAGKDESQGDFVFSSPSAGEISACFENSASTFDSKVVTVELMAESEENRKQSRKTPAPNESQTKVEESVANIGSSLGSIHRNQLYLRSRDNRNFSTVKSTESRIYWFAIFQTLLIIGMAILQVTIVQGFFKGSLQKGRV
ncbi:hypothetical protein M427DRAFT_116183 [Gonapodya prolifera JEL478]|uniref:GOLD domain-containing protein n=1 Tax=Gonapodya prolifera (strain JEL478) TaxID=1344416 RepID=A0A139A163_GONPJ|nr:hypothetical protein M427DRAFT_116183 [Gonapodya prolifera JEL478]|eukprot:KXS10265.1 hypothetical protein M427DRAFT_116183 [Gonapodya prolifera JEL478]